MLNGVAAALEKRRESPMGDRGMIVSVVSWILVVAMVFTLITRLTMKFVVIKKGRRFGLDDVFIVLAALFSVGQTAAVSMEAMHALGQHAADLTVEELRIFQKAEYAGCMLYIANMGCARISVCLLIMKILPGRIAKCAALGFAIFSGLWTFSGVMVTVFPCPFPQPWHFLGKQCIDVISFINYIGITNIVVEVILVIIPLVVWNIRLSAGRSISVSSVFLSRLSVVAAVVAQLVYFNRDVDPADVTYHHWRTALCVQIAQNLSIITACLPCLHPFILSVLSGAIKPDTLHFECTAPKKIKRYFKRSDPQFNSMSSQSSTQPMKEKQPAENYCHPLATYGLDRSSAHLNSQHFNRFPSTNTVPRPPSSEKREENVFMRCIDIPDSRPQSPASFPPPTTTTQGPDHDSPLPKSLCDIGVIPLAEWETEDSSLSDGGQPSEHSSASRRPRPNSDYVFSREKVISVPEANVMYEERGEWKRYPPPPPSRSGNR
ncbi:uncharacterized protein EI97DRAFT_440579 [Westerdykella ornata]|uniref:Rhodopsin domain-containing protein n=1 Tax=Westerdykella ornata TaxID=318751 RepID=A0A6A6JS74_WESOR|nr:uncharacterized protein EI97DRAFT_440579 [Westerdykella ornata]KAF2279114.1 hypothetical protein EI97DRAFT_440579 [Westerdykella ornata]